MKEILKIVAAHWKYGKKGTGVESILTKEAYERFWELCRDTSRTWEEKFAEYGLEL